MKRCFALFLLGVLIITSAMPLSASAPAGKNPFALEVGGDYHLYAYDADRLGYVNLGYAYWSAEWDQPYLDKAVAAINALPVLEKTDEKPSGKASYGLMSVTNGDGFVKKQFYLYENLLTVNGTAYRISQSQYDSLKKVMAEGASAGSPVPQWFAYMNPDRVTKINCTDEKGKIKQMKASNVGFAAADLRYINISSVKTYKPGSKKLDDMPFKAVYTFDTGNTYTVYVSDITPRKKSVTFYVEASDMSYACEYVTDGFISNYFESAQGMISGPANPRTM